MIKRTQAIMKHMWEFMFVPLHGGECWQVCDEGGRND